MRFSSYVSCLVALVLHGHTLLSLNKGNALPVISLILLFLKIFIAVLTTKPARIPCIFQQLDILLVDVEEQGQRAELRRR